MISIESDFKEKTEMLISQINDHSNVLASYFISQSEHNNKARTENSYIKDISELKSIDLVKKKNKSPTIVVG